MLNAADLRLDWRREFARLDPYIKGRGGVIQVEYVSDHAAPMKFNHLLKEDFAKSGPTSWRSLRIDHEWFTTRRVEGVVDEIDRLLTETGFRAEFATEASAPVQILTDVEVEGNMTTNISGLHVNYGGVPLGRDVRARTEAVFEAMRGYVGAGGRFMVTLNDMPLSVQTEFWRQVWHAGLPAACGEDMLLVVLCGPKARRQMHQDSPEASERIVLPDTVEDDSERDYHFYDDISDAFAKAGIETARVPANVHLENNRTSILHINMKLSAAIMSAKRAQERL